MSIDSASARTISRKNNSSKVGEVVLVTVTSCNTSGRVLAMRTDGLGFSLHIKETDTAIFASDVPSYNAFIQELNEQNNKLSILYESTTDDSCPVLQVKEPISNNIIIHADEQEMLNYIQAKNAAAAAEDLEF